VTDAHELADHPFLSGLGDSLTRTLSAFARERAFARGDYVFREGDAADTFYLVVSGRASLETHVPGKGPTRVETVGPGEVLGLSWMFPPSRVHLDARALDDLGTFEIDAGPVRAAMDQDLGLGYALSRGLLRVMYDRLERVRLQRLDVYRS
jgi:CRP/FNR family transcriptional regulator, cyclic AMP receptor protein